ncbi:MAG: lysylphosphatidylglycerol synthetase family protein [Anaerolineales bacterium]|nr:lysylphosphatidylglycerol synthetase family protein [Anaerolineales bacterium]MCA9931437.1 lysylphosphatidylglycerol synthetase family protein [Anaerolineales bacterium]
MNQRRRIGWQRWLFAALIIGFLWILAKRFADIQQLVGTLIQGDWLWITAAIILEIGYYLAFAALFKSAFDITSVPARYRDLVPISFAFLFANTTTASGGTAGLALFVDDVHRRGGSAARATAGTLLAHTANYGMFAALLSFGLFFLYLQNDLTGLELASALILFLLVLVLCSTLILGLRWPNGLRRLLDGVQRFVLRIGGWIKRPSLLPDNWADKNADDFIAASQAIAAHPTRLVWLLLIALFTHFLHILVLLTLFAAFHQPTSPGILLAGYTLSVLFLIVSPTPNGIGVVEAIVPIMYRSLGVSSENGIAITFAFRGITFWIPMVIGFILLRQLKMFSGSGRSLAESGQVRLIAILTALMGLLNVLTAVQPDWLAPLSALTRLSPVAVQQGSRITAVISGFLLLILANGLWRHKRMAWGLTLFVLSLSIFSHLLQSDPAAAGLGVLLVVFLISQRSHFVARSDPPSAWQGIQVLAAALAFTLAYGTIGFYLLDRYYGQSFNLLSAWRQALLLFTTLTEPTLQPVSAYDFFTDSIYIVGLSTLAYALFMLLRPVLLPSPATERERSHARHIVNQYGQTAQSAFVLLPERSYFFSRGGSVITHIHRRRQAIALGRPIGPAGDREQAVADFRDYCRRHDWEAAFYDINPEIQSLFVEAGFETICIGHDGVLALDAFALSSVPSGYQTEVVQPPFNDALIEQLRLVSDEWLATQRAKERPFTADRFSRAYLQQATLVILYNPTRAIVAVAAAYPTPDKQAMVLSMVRFRQNVPESALHFLLGALARWSQTRGFKRLFLGLSPLPMTASNGTSTSYWNRIWHRFYLRRKQAEQVYDLHQLADSLQPQWEPRYLAYSSTTSLPVISNALYHVTGY